MWPHILSRAVAAINPLLCPPATRGSRPTPPPNQSSCPLVLFPFPSRIVVRMRPCHFPVARARIPTSSQILPRRWAADKCSGMSAPGSLLNLICGTKTPRSRLHAPSATEGRVYKTADVVRGPRSPAALRAQAPAERPPCRPLPASSPGCASACFPT